MEVRPAARITGLPAEALSRPRLRASDRVFWLALRRCRWRWKETLAIVQPETVVRWHRAGFRRYWRWKSRRHAGRPSTGADIRALVHRMAAENPAWEAPRIHGEIQKLGLEVSERTVSPWWPDSTNPVSGIPGAVHCTPTRRD